MPDLSGFLTSVARFFVKTCFHKKCGVFEACKKVKDFFDTLGRALLARYLIMFLPDGNNLITPHPSQATPSPQATQGKAKGGASTANE